MISIEPFIESYKEAKISRFLHAINKKLPEYFSNSYHGDFTKWKAALDKMHSIVQPAQQAIDFNLNTDAVTIGNSSHLAEQREDFISALKEFMPWRKV